MPSSMELSPSPPSYDYVPPPRQASEPLLNVESAYGVVNRPKSLNVDTGEYKVPVTNSGGPRKSSVPSVYGVVTNNRHLEHRLTIAAVPSRYALLNYPKEPPKTRQPVDSVYGVVQAPDSGRKPPCQADGPKCPVNTTCGDACSNSSSETMGNAKDIHPQRSPSLRKTSHLDSSYELVELPVRRDVTLARNDRSTPISIPSQERALSRVESTYDTVTLPPMRRIDPIGAPESPYGNLDPIITFQQEQARADENSRTTREEGVGDGARYLGTRREPEGAKEQEIPGMATSPRSHIAEYENVVLPLRTASGRYQNDSSIYQNTPVSPPTYEYNVPNPRANTLPGSPSHNQGNAGLSRSYSEKHAKDSESPGSHGGSPSHERRHTDYENVELPRRSPSVGSPSSLKSRNAYEILPPHILHGPGEPTSPKPDAQGRVRPVLPKPYHESRVTAYDVSSKCLGKNVLVKLYVY